MAASGHGTKKSLVVLSGPFLSSFDLSRVGFLPLIILANDNTNHTLACPNIP